MRRSRRAPLTREPDTAAGGAGVGPVLPAVRIAPVRELAAGVLGAPLMRQAERLARWMGTEKPLSSRGFLRPEDAAGAIAELDIAEPEFNLVWQTAIGAGLIAVTGQRARPQRGSLHASEPETVLAAWRGALDAVLRAGPAETGDELEGLAAALYAAGGPVRMDALAEAFAAAAWAHETGTLADDLDTGLSQALETLADLGVAEVGIDERDEQLTVTLTPLGVAGMRDRLTAAGLHAPLAGQDPPSDAAALLATLAGYDAEDGEHVIAAWLAHRTPSQAATELLEAARTSSPGGRGAAFAILDRLGRHVIALVQSALAEPVLQPHAAIWLRERGVQAELSPAQRAWLLVDLGVGLLEDADAGAVAADLLPDLPAGEQAELVAGLWQVAHPGLVELLTTLAEHHPEPRVAKAARKAALKARSRLPGDG